MDVTTRDIWCCRNPCKHIIIAVRVQSLLRDRSGKEESQIAGTSVPAVLHSSRVPYRNAQTIVSAKIVLRPTRSCTRARPNGTNMHTRTGMYHSSS